MYSKYFLMNPLQKRRGMPKHTRHRKKGTSNLREKRKRGKSPKKEKQSKVKAVLFSHSSQHKEMSPHVSIPKQTHNLTTTMQPALMGWWQVAVSLTFKRLINITKVDCMLLVPALMS